MRHPDGDSDARTIATRRTPTAANAANANAANSSASAAKTSAAKAGAAATLVGVLVGVVFLVAWAVAGRTMPVSHSSAPAWVEPLVTILSYGIAGAVILDRRPDLPFGWLLAGVAGIVVVEVLVAYPAVHATAHGSTNARWGLVALTAGFLPVAAQGLVNIRFPSGRPAGRAGRVLEKAILAGAAVAVIGGLLGGSMDTIVPGLPHLDHPLTAGTTVGVIGDGLVAAVPVTILLGVVAGLGVVRRYLRAEGTERQQLKWRAVGVLTSLALFPLAVTERLGVVQLLDSPVFVLTLIVPVLRYRLWAIDPILRRSLAYGVTIALLAVAAIGVGAALARVAPSRIVAPILAAVVALAFLPLARRVHRLFYGEAYQAVRELGRQLNLKADDDVLGSAVRIVGTSLRLPYVAIEWPDRTLLAAHGEPGPVDRRWPLAYEQRVEGFLVASPRRGEDAFARRDVDLLGDIAGQIGAAVHTAGLTAQLRRSRQELVAAREEERRRLRRDLHDGLGPVLTAIGLHLDAAGTGGHVKAARDATSQAMADLRRLVHGLRPPALDLGLAAALRSQIGRLGGDLAVTVDVPDLPDLPAAAEVAAYRIAVEAVTNVVRHSAARHCCVRVALVGDDLVVRVQDDGTATDPWTPGVGLAAMRERTDELGGALTAGPGPTGGRVVATIPVAAR